MNKFKKGDLIYDTYDKFFRIFRVVATTEERNEELRNYDIKNILYCESLILNLVDGLTAANNDQLSSFRSLDEDYPTIAKAIRGEKILIDDKYCQNRISELSTHLYCKNKYALSLESRMIELRQERDNAQQKLAAYEDETPITDEFLNRNFTYSALSNSWDYSQISVTKAKEIDDLYYVSMLFGGAAIEIKTIGQLRMFLTILGLCDFVKQLK